MAYQLDTSLAVMEKRRNLDTHDQSESVQIIGEVKGKTAIIVDDNVTTGGTIAHSAKAMKEQGDIKVIVAASHGLFTGQAFEIL
jgi:ribose-phosphate pyrophosphokinase